MLKFNPLYAAIIIFSFQVNANTHVDRMQELNGVALSSGKEDSTRTFTGKIQKSFPFPLNVVKKSITHFSERCNNAYKSKRNFISQDMDCKYHNENMVETFVVKELKPQDALKHLTEYFVIGRQVYNRGSYKFYELVQIKDDVNEGQQKTTIISLHMLNNDEVKKYITPAFENDSVFSNSSATYTLTEVSPTETTLTYEYKAQTDHWILNKEVTVPQVFVNISKGIVDLVTAIENESMTFKRELASQR